MSGVVEGVTLASMSDLSLEPRIEPGEGSTVVAYIGTARDLVAGSGSCLCFNGHQLWIQEESRGVRTPRAIAASQTAVVLRRPL